MGCRSFFLLAACFAFAASQAPAQERHYLALVIGNGKYTRKPLAWPVDNAQAVAARLRELQYEVVLAENTNHRRLIGALAAFRHKIAANDVAVLYYAGRVTRSHGVAALVPLDQTDPDIDLGVPLRSVLDAVERSRSAANVVVLDVLPEWPVFGLDIAREWLAAMPQAPARTVVLSSGAAAGRGSLTSELLHAMERPERALGDVVEEIRGATAGRELFRLEGSVRGDIPAAPGTEPAVASKPTTRKPPDPIPSKPPTADEGGGKAKAPASALTRFFTIEALPSVSSGAAFSVLVSLTREKRTPGVKVPQVGSNVLATTDGALRLNLPCLPKCELDVVLSAPGFDFTAGSNTVAIEMTADGDSIPARFNLRAPPAGEARLEATFWYRGAFLARAVRPIQVTGLGAAGTPAPARHP